MLTLNKYRFELLELVSGVKTIPELKRKIKRVNYSTTNCTLYENLKRFEKYGLVESIRQGRFKYIKLTEDGKYFVNFYRKHK